MPKTRVDLERDAKVAEILEAAERRLRDGGYDALSMVGIARDLGIAQNAVYWYFPSKDRLFVAALERMLRKILARKPAEGQSVERKVMWFVDQLEELEDVRAAMYERARVSPVVADFVAELNEAWRRMLSNVLAGRLAESELEVAVDTFIATMQGAFLQPASKAERRRMIAFALERLTQPAEQGMASASRAGS